MQRQGLLELQNSPMYTMYYEPMLMPKTTAATRTQAIYWMLERKIMEMSMARFDWQGLPKEVSVRNLEMALMYNALAIFYKNPRNRMFYALYGAPAGMLNLQQDPTRYLAYGNGIVQNQYFDMDECVPIWANKMRMPDVDIIRIYASRLADLDRTIEINSKNARQNKVLAATEETQLSVENFNREAEAGNNAIVVQGGLETTLADSLTVLDLGMDPRQIGELSILRGRIWNELMTMLGINNANQDKKERLVAAEVSGNDDMVETIRMTNLAERKRACILMNEKYGLTVTVEYVTDMNQTAMKDVGSGDQQNQELQK
jgi:hypothetical protein